MSLYLCAQPQRIDGRIVNVSVQRGERLHIVCVLSQWLCQDQANQQVCQWPRRDRLQTHH